MSKCLLTGWARRVKWKKIRQLRSYEHRNFLIALMIANIFDITSGFLLDILGDSNAKEGTRPSDRTHQPQDTDNLLALSNFCDSVPF